MKVLHRYPGLSSSSPVRQAQDRLRRGSIHLVLALFFAFFFLACSDDDSDFAVRPSDGSSSSRVKPQSSDSETSMSSSSSEYKRVPCNVAKDENCIEDDRDGQTYRTVKIGDQVWMAENLNYVYLQSTENLDSISFCYNDSAEYCEKYGRLYTWAAAMDSVGVWSTDAKGCGNNPSCFPSGTIRGICPEGWHLPSRDEWDTLLTVVGDSSDAGTRLKDEYNADINTIANAPKKNVPKKNAVAEKNTHPKKEASTKKSTEKKSDAKRMSQKEEFSRGGKE